MRWISVQSGMPKQGKIVDLWVDGYRVTNCWWDKEHPGSDQWYWAREGGDPFCTGGTLNGVHILKKEWVTHYMEVTPPEPEQKVNY